MDQFNFTPLANVQENELLVAGNAKQDEEEQTEYLHRGLARRSFERRFEFADQASENGPDWAGRFSARWIWAAAPLASAEEYRRKAEEFRKQATSVPHGDLRQAYLDIAHEYERLAMEVEKAEAQKRGGD